MKFELNESQLIELNKWQEKIKDLFGEYGNYDYTFTNYGIGMSVKVFSHLTKTELNLSEIEKW